MSELGGAADVGRPFPERPYLPPSLVCMTAVVVCLRLVLLAHVVGRSLAAACLVIGLVSLGAYVCLRRVSVSLACLCRASVALVAAALLCSCASALGARALIEVDALANELSSTSVSSLVFVVESDPSQTSSGWMCRARVVGADASGSVWLSSTDRLGFGERLRVVGRFTANGDDEWGTSSRARGISGRVKLVHLISREEPGGALGALVALRSRLVGAISPELGAGRALMAGVLVSDRTQLDEQGIEDEFATAGLSHLVAVSGSHLVVVASCLEAALVALGVGPKRRFAAVSLVCGAYVVFCACPSSAVRSWAMLVAALAGRLLGRRSHAPSGMAITGVVMCYFDPHVACDLGFILSVLSVGALSLFSDHMAWLLSLLPPHLTLAAPLRAAFRHLPRLSTAAARAASASLDALAATLVCQLATLPLCAITFGRVSLVAPLANVVVGPIFGPIVTLGAVACALVWMPIVGPALLWATSALCELAVLLSRALASLPHACVPVSLGAEWELVPLVAGTAVYLAWPRPTRGRLLVMLVSFSSGLFALLLVPSALAGPSVTILDVGQGDAILVREGLHAVLVDAGPEGSLVEALARNRVYSVDAIVLTHLHDDHVGGLEELEGLIDVGAVYVGEGVSGAMGEELAGVVERLCGRGAQELAYGDVLSMGSFTLSCLWPRGPTEGSENEDSVCLRLSCSARPGVFETLLRQLTGSQFEERTLTALLTGDAESDVLAQIVGEAGDVDLLKVGHHGSKASITADEAAALEAELAVASAGEGNSYGHPTQECIEVLASVDSTFLCTKDVGDVTVEPGAEGPVLSPS